MEIATRLGDTLLEVTHVEADFELAGVTLVFDGELVAPATGRVGLVDYTATPVEPPVRSIPFASGGDHRWIPYAAAALAVHVGLWGLASTTSPPPEPRVASKPTPRPVKLARVAAPPAPKAPVPDDRARDRVADTKSQGQARAVQGARGAAGAQTSPTARRARGHIAVKNVGEEAQLTKAEAIAQAQRAGILGQAQTVLDNYASLHGNDALTSGFDAISATGNSGTDTTSSGFGLGRTGSGPGGGGGGYGTIGTGNMGHYSAGTTHGHGWGGSIAPPTSPQWRSWQGGDYYYTPLPYRLRRPLPMVQICPREGAPACTVEGALDKAVVRRYVKRNAQKLSYCFERALLYRSNLRGDVSVTFAINAEGHVETARATGLDDEVATCVRGVFEQLEFPRGATLVEYVLRFSMSR